MEENSAQNPLKDIHPLSTSQVKQEETKTLNFPIINNTQQEQKEVQQIQQVQKIEQMPQSSSQIEIQVIDPIIKDSFRKYVVYTVKGRDRDGPFEILRRYNDFFSLRKCLVERWPGCFIPSMPPKKAVGNLTIEFIEKRRIHLDDFCQRIAHLPYLYYSEEFQIFVKNQSAQVKEALSGLKKMNNSELIDRFQNAFTELSGNEINTELVLKISTFKNYLTKVGQMLKNFSQMAKNAQKARLEANEKFAIFMNYMLPEYEKNCLTEYVPIGDDKLIFGNQQDAKIIEMLSKVKELNSVSYSFSELEKHIKREKLELEAFNDVMIQKKNFEVKKEAASQKQKAVQLDLQKLLAKGSVSGIQEKTAKFEQQIAETGAEMEQLQFICDIITVILGYIEIDRFKNENASNYYNLLNKMAKLESEFTKLQIDLWEYVESNSNVMMSEPIL